MIDKKKRTSPYRFRALREVRSPKSVRKFALSIVAITLVLLLFLLVAPWQQFSAGAGRVIAFAPDERLQVISSTIDGRISRWFVAEGGAVQAGDALVELSDVDPQALDRLRSELDSAIGKLSAVQQAVELSALNLSRQKELAEKGLSSQRTFELAQLEYNKLLSDLESARAEVARVQVRFSRQSSQTITAPTGGIVQRVYGSKGGMIVKTGDPLIVLAPENNSRAVELLVEAIDLPLIVPGRKVRLQFEGWPAVQIIGWPSLAVGTFAGVVRVIDPAVDAGRGLARVIVFPEDSEAPWPDDRFLRLGARVQGWVLLDVVDLWFELWRRFNGFPKSTEGLFSPERREKSGGSEW